VQVGSAACYPLTVGVELLDHFNVEAVQELLFPQLLFARREARDQVADCLKEAVLIADLGHFCSPPPA
jgi:hypothetical protein